MHIELYKSDPKFIIDLLHRTHLMRIIPNLQNATEHPECDEFVLCELDMDGVQELVGQLSFETNHNSEKNVRERACDIADSIEVQIRR
jgi:hypothetical protein